MVTYAIICYIYADTIYGSTCMQTICIHSIIPQTMTNNFREEEKLEITERNKLKFDSFTNQSEYIQNILILQ